MRSARSTPRLAKRLPRRRAVVAMRPMCTSAQVTAIGSHGQTLRHQPNGAHPFTWQIGNPDIIAERTGITTVADFRRRDVAAGGEGAPLAPALHQAVLASAIEARAVINIGGIGNITWLPPDGTPCRLRHRARQLPHGWLVAAPSRQARSTEDGEWAASGRVDASSCDLAPVRTVLLPAAAQEHRAGAVQSRLAGHSIWRR